MPLRNLFAFAKAPPTVESVAIAINEAVNIEWVLLSHDPDPQLGSNPLGGLQPKEYLKVLQRVDLKKLEDTDEKEAFLDILRDTALSAINPYLENAPQLWGDVIGVMKKYTAKHGLVQPSDLEPDQTISVVDVTVHGVAHRMAKIMHKLKESSRADTSKERLDGMAVMAINALADICKGHIPDYFAKFKDQHLPGYVLTGKQDILLQIAKCATGEKSAKAAVDVIVDLIETGQIRKQDAETGIACLDLLRREHPHSRDYASGQLKRLLKNGTITGAAALLAMQNLADAKIEALETRGDSAQVKQMIAGFFESIISSQHDQGVRLPGTNHFLSVRIREIGSHPVIAHNFRVDTHRALYDAAEIIRELESEIKITDDHKLSRAFEVWTSEQIAKAGTAALTLSL